MALRQLGYTTKMMGYIDSTVKRVGKTQDGYYTSASFELWDRYYTMTADGSLYRDGEQVRINMVMNGMYPEYCLYETNTNNVLRLKAYQLSLICLTDTFYSKYMSDDKLVVNHMVVSSLSHSESNRNPNSEVSFNPRYLELVSASQNNRHSIVMKTFGLYGVFLSALDLEPIKALLTSKMAKFVNTNSYNTSLVKNYYMSKPDYDGKKLVF